MATGPAGRYSDVPMMGTLAVLALVASALLLATMLLALVMLRKGEGPRYGSSRAYEANRRDAFRALTGEDVDALPGGQWYDPAFESPGAGAAIAEAYREAAIEAIRAIAPEPPEADHLGGLRLGEARVVPAVSTRALREALDPAREAEGLVAGVVLFNPEPPGGSAARVALPVPSLFPALRRVGREDLVERFEGLRREALSLSTTPQGGAP